MVITKQELKEIYNTSTCIEGAEKLKVTVPTYYKILKKAGIKLVKKSGRPFSTKIIEVIDDEKQEEVKQERITFDGKLFQNITQEYIDFLQVTYKAVDIQAELLKATAWLIANPTQRKKNYERFINSWCSKAQERGGNSFNRNTNYRG